jgi:hypothetical protein
VQNKVTNKNIKMDISGSISNSSGSLNMRPLFAGYPFQGTSTTTKLIIIWIRIDVEITTKKRTKEAAAAYVP